MIQGLKCVLPERRKSFSVARERANIETILQNLPENEIIKLISFGAFSSIGLIYFVAKREIIKRLTMSTLAVGAKHIRALNSLYQQGRLHDARFFVGSIMKMDREKKKQYLGVEDRADVLSRVCQERGWSLQTCKNHSKILLMDTDRGKYVVETSSNLNENPKFEQFSFEKSETLYNFYTEFFDGLAEAAKETAGEPAERGRGPGDPAAI